MEDINYVELYFKHLEAAGLSGDDQIQGDCPFCYKEQHFYASRETGQCDCKVCDFQGNAITFLRALKNMSQIDTIKEINSFRTRKPIKIARRKKPRFSQASVDQYIDNMSEKKLEEFAKERGLSREILKNSELGMNKQGQYTLPARDKKGVIRNIYKKCLGGDTISSRGAENILYGVEDLFNCNEKRIFVAEGPWSALALKDNGYPAVGTAGAGNIKKYEIEYFSGKVVYIIPDNDEAGFKGAERFSGKVFDVAQEVRIMKFTSKLKSGWDIRQYLEKYGKAKFEKYIQSCKKYEKETGDVVVAGQFNPNITADKILSEHKIINSNKVFYEYKDGYYQPVPDEVVKKWVKRELKNQFKISRCNDVIHSLLTESFISGEKINEDKHRLNMKNGILNIRTGKLDPHASDFISTIRIPIEYDSKAECPLFIETLGQIFADDVGKISVLQEFMGYCLTPNNSHQVALLNVGEGANGKSVLFSVFEKIVGKENCSSVPMECFGNRHYIAQLSGKLVNISIESEAKKAIHDANFKAIVSGDTITADRKYGQPFEFNPFVKLIFAMNDLPRVDDKTDAFFRRLIIIRYTQQFQGKKDDRNLKNKLLEELSGILNWMIEGLGNLENRGRFQVTSKMRMDVEKYRIEQNNVLQFVSEECAVRGVSKSGLKRKTLKFKKSNGKILNNEWSVTKKLLYIRYVEYCESSGCFPLSKINFGRHLKKHFAKIEESRGSTGHIWINIKLKHLLNK